MTMFMAAAMIAAGAASPAAPLPHTTQIHSHNVRIEHRGSPVDIAYRADVSVKHKQVGTAPPNRPSTARCRWTATVNVVRSVADAAPRAVESPHSFEGSRAGDCVTNRTAIAREVAGRGGEVRSHLLAAAERDRLHLLAEFNAASPTASTD